jgi:adenosylcobyric acid synthase
VGGTIGTSWHGLLEGDALRRALLSWAAEIAGRRWLPGTRPFAEVRERRLDAVADLIEQNLDTAALEALIAGGAPAGLPVVESRAVAAAR